MIYFNRNIHLPTIATTSTDKSREDNHDGYETMEDAAALRGAVEKTPSLAATSLR